MKLAKVQITLWDRPGYFEVRELDLKKGDKVIVRAEAGLELATALEILDLSPEESEALSCSGRLEASAENTAPRPEAESPDEDRTERTAGKKWEPRPVLRLATPADLSRLPDKDEKKKALGDCRQMVMKLNLPMKLVDAHFSFDGARLVFAFIADGRVDFRDLVKELTRHFNRTIRLQQIGIRDEAKIMGDYGHCGRPLCCRRHLKELQSITSEMAELQQCAHRGSERISGICGRLMCCLQYEQKGYEDLAAAMPPIGAKVKADGKRGVVVAHHPLKQSVNIEVKSENGESSTIVEVDLNRHKKK